ncbi:MAG TPA: arginine deiminase-related protein, partial [Candidatus Saccharimonadales bacterium]
MKNLQAASAVLMVRPISFSFNEQTAVTNTFQNRPEESAGELHLKANREFDAMIAKLRGHGVHVTVFEDTDTKRKPDAVFPNNWFSAWPDGKVYLYPMATESRRIERSYDALQDISEDFVVKQITDLSGVEEYDLALESTGVMIFDHINKVVYGCISPRCDAGLFTAHANELGYKPVLFHSYGTDGTAVYHTNVMMGLQTTTAVICAESITDETERNMVLNTLKETGHEVVEITQAQMSNFCGNVLELQNGD